MSQHSQLTTTTSSKDISMATPHWMSDNLSSMLLGKDRESKSSVKKEIEGSPTPPFQPTQPSSPKDNIVQQIHPISSSKKRASFPVYLPQDLHQRFSAAVQADGRKKSSLIVSWITEYLRQREQHEN